MERPTRPSSQSSSGSKYRDEIFDPIRTSCASSIFASLSTLYLDSRFSDMTVTCQGQKFKAHRAVVCTQSPFFEKALSSNFQESATGVVDLPDDDPEVVKLFLQFLYTGNYVDGVIPKLGRPTAVATYSPDAIDDFLGNLPGVIIRLGTEGAIDEKIKLPGNRATNRQGNGSVEEPTRAAAAGPSSESGDDPEDQDYDSEAASSSSQEPPEEYDEFCSAEYDEEAPVDPDHDEDPRVIILNRLETAKDDDGLAAAREAYDVPALRLLSRDRFYRAAESGWEVADYFPDVVDELYSSTPSTEIAMREIVCRLVGNRIRQESVRDRMTPVMRKHGDFAVGVLNYALPFGRWLEF